MRDKNQKSYQTRLDLHAQNDRSPSQKPPCPTSTDSSPRKTREASKLTSLPSEHDGSNAASSTHGELCGPKTPTVPDMHSPQVFSSRRPFAPQSSRFNASQSGAAVQLAAFRLELATSRTFTLGRVGTSSVGMRWVVVFEGRWHWLLVPGVAGVIQGNMGELR